jgi:hypothetical protein
LIELWPRNVESAFAFTPAVIKIEAQPVAQPVAQLVQPDRRQLRGRPCLLGADSEYARVERARLYSDEQIHGAAPARERAGCALRG